VTLAEPDFVARDPSAIVSEMVADFEAATGRTLHPAQVERLLIDVVAYRESLYRVAVQEAAKLNLVTYARGVMLDHLGSNIGVARLPARASITRILFIRDTAVAGAVIVPAGTVVEIGGGRLFATDRDATIAASATSAEVLATAVETGAAGNGFVAAAAALQTAVVGVAEVATTATSYGGADAEDDDRYRARIMAGTNRASVGTPARYRELAMGVDQSIADVAVVSPEPGSGVVRVHVLADGGVASARLLADVLAVLGDDRYRMVTDVVEVRAATPRPFVVAARITLVAGASAATVMAQAEAAAAGLAARLRRQLGGEVVPSQFIAALSVPGVHRVVLDSPAELVLEPHQWADCTAIALVEAAP
jgi:phage-related baseplate assembly protein